ncbi:MGMT family protein [Streptomyces sp. WMMC897]|uniref:MGMT family protein n=1 Tax=Streptomyces sp. WMMC897 TaxID=3014782 RepID=UPI0022B6F759|nr:MGMT family protein [Streptomyces sp. WMMC897]MCZ7416669.1 MGMT family protein [Streptomyces sp. WMMC897]
MTLMGELPEYAERVLEVAELIPPGRVLTYGDVARWLREEDAELDAEEPAAASAGPAAEQRDGSADPGFRGPAISRPARSRGTGGPRQVGRVMALYGGGVPWWRVVRADGALLPGHEQRALAHYRAEGTPLREPATGARPRLDLPRARWDGTGGDVPGAEAGHGTGHGIEGVHPEDGGEPARVTHPGASL